MVAITNFTTLKQAIIDEAEDDGTEFNDFLPTAIDLTEERLFKELDLPELTSIQQGTLTAAVATLDKPTGYEFSEYLMITPSAGSNTILKKKTEGFIREYWAGTSIEDTGIPKYYCDLSSTQFRLAPTPESNYGYELKYTAKPAKLSDSNLTNYYVDNIKDALFFGCMEEMARFMKAWDQVSIWNGRYIQARDTWNLEMMRYRRDAGEVPMNVQGSGPNSIKHTINSNS